MQAQLDLAAVADVREPPVHQQRPLYDVDGEEKVEAHRAEAVTLEEGHQEAEPDQHHDVHVLEHCGEHCDVIKS